MSEYRLKGRIETEDQVEIYLRRKPIDRQGYDKRGRYWGVGAPLWEFDGEGGYYGYFRASDKKAAKEILRKDFPRARVK